MELKLIALSSLVVRLPQSKISYNTGRGGVYLSRFNNIIIFYDNFSFMGGGESKRVELWPGQGGTMLGIRLGQDMGHRKIQYYRNSGDSDLLTIC